MKLIQSEIDLLPGERPEANPGANPLIRRNGGSAALDLYNQGAPINTFRVWVRSEKYPWLAEQATIQRLDVQSPGEVADVVNGRIYSAQALPDKHRKLSITFQIVPRDYVQAGVYRVHVEIESQHPVGVPPNVRSRSTLPLDIVVRPIEDWQVSVDLAKSHVGLFRPWRNGHIIIQNRGNDWLYLELLVPDETKERKIRLDAQRIAIPPAIAGDKPGLRRVPASFFAKGKGLTGPETPIGLKFDVRTLDAPSVAHFPAAEGNVHVPSLNFGMPVLVPKDDANRQSQVRGNTPAKSVNVSLTYRPLFRIIGDPTAKAWSLIMRALAAGTLLLMFFYGLAFILGTFQNKATVSMGVESQKDGYVRLTGPGIADPGSTVHISGLNVKDAELHAYQDDSEITSDLKPARAKDGSIAFIVPNKPDKTTLKLEMQFAWQWFRLPGVKARGIYAITINNPKKVEKKPAILHLQSTIEPGEKLSFDFEGLGNSPFEVRFDAKPITSPEVTKTGEGRGTISFEVPTDIQPGPKLVSLERNGSPIEVEGQRAEGHVEVRQKPDPIINDGGQPSAGTTAESGMPEPLVPPSQEALPPGYIELAEGLADNKKEQVRAAIEAGAASQTREGFAIAAIAAAVQNDRNKAEDYHNRMESSPASSSAIVDSLTAVASAGLNSVTPKSELSSVREWASSRSLPKELSKLNLAIALFLERKGESPAVVRTYRNSG